MKYLLGIDIGTSSTKVLACTPSGEVLAQESRSYPMHQPRPGWREQGVEEVIAATEEAIAAVINRMKQQPLALSLSSAMHSLLLADDAAKPLTPLITWADQRASAQARRLKGSERGQMIYEATGTPLHPMSPLCKLIWMKESDYPPFREARRIFTIKSYLLYRWFRRHLIDESDASATGLFDILQKQWHDPALKAAGIRPAQLPMPVKTTEQISAWMPAAAKRLGLDPETPVIMGASDGCLANLGSGVTGPGAVAMTIGTSGAIRVTLPAPLIDEQGRLFNYILDDERYVCGGSVNSGGKLLEWFRKNVAENATVETLFLQAKEVAAGSEGLLCLPYLLGERAPVWDGRARGAFVGLTDRHGTAHFFRALLEGIGYNLYQISRLMETHGARLDYIRASGGWTRSPLWLQMMSDIFSLPVTVEKGEDASARGAVLLALKTLGIDDEAATEQLKAESATHFEPDPAQHKIYRRYFDLYTGIYPQLRYTFESLGELQGVT